MNDRQQGFVLVGTIWLTLIMLLFAGLFNAYSSRYLDAAIEAKARIDSNLKQKTLENTLMFLFATNGLNRRGLELKNGYLVRLDGTEYPGFGETRFTVNDYAGLVGLNSSNPYHLENLLDEFEFSGIQRRSLVDNLKDYVDSDDYALLNGKEAPAYRVAGLPVPTNDYLRTSGEIRRVYGWSGWLDAHSGFDTDWLSTNWRSRININTVPRSLLLKLLPLNEEERNLVVERREQKPFMNMSDLNSSLRLRATLDEDFFTFLPTGDFRFRIYSANNRKLTTLAVRFTPMNLKAPWHIDYRYQSERNFDLSATEESDAEEGIDWQLSATEEIR